MKMTLGADKSVIISGVWNPALPFSVILNEETPKGMHLGFVLYICVGNNCVVYTY